MDQPGQEKMFNRFNIRQMLKSNHPGLLEISRFIEGELHDCAAVKTGEHLVSCTICMSRASTLRLTGIFDRWNATSHGISDKMGRLQPGKKLRDKPASVIRSAEEDVSTSSSPGIQVLAGKLAGDVMHKYRKGD